MRNAGVSLSRGAVAPGYRGQSSQTKSRAAFGSTGRSRGNGQRESRLGFPFLVRKGRFLPILFASTRAKPLDAACNPPGPPRRGNSGWDSPFSSRPIHNGGVSLSRGLKPLDTACNPPRRNPVLPTAARNEAEATGSGNPRFFLAEVRVDLAALKVARLQVRMRLCDALRQEAHALALAAHVAADQHRLGEP